MAMNHQMTLHRTSMTVMTVLLIWVSTVVITAQSGLLSQLYLPIISMIVAATIALPTVWYSRSQALQDWTRSVGLHRIVAFHIWRILAAALFFYFGLRGELPLIFWVLAGVGDFIAGCYAVYITMKMQPTARDYRRFHIVGFADFVIAVGTGLTYTVLQDPQIATITILPMALIPLFGVGISGASHLVSFDMMNAKN